MRDIKTVLKTVRKENVQSDHPVTKVREKCFSKKNFIMNHNIDLHKHLNMNV